MSIVMGTPIPLKKPEGGNLIVVRHRTHTVLAFYLGGRATAVHLDHRRKANLVAELTAPMGIPRPRNGARKEARG